jgi:hypothetical protein
LGTLIRKISAKAQKADLAEDSREIGNTNWGTLTPSGTSQDISN